MKIFSPKAIITLAAAALLLPASILVGEEQNTGEDWTAITCDGNLYMDYHRQRVIFFNNVRVENPRGRIQSDRLTVFFSTDGKTVEKAEGEGNVRINAEGRSGRSEKIIYYPGEKKAVLIGEASVTAGGDTVGGGMITFFLDKMDMEVAESPTLEYILEGDYQVDF
jgi:lipopolysaccharide transport protein LptA